MIPEIMTGENEPDYRDVFSGAVCSLACAVPEMVAVAAASSGESGLSCFKDLYPARFFDAGPDVPQAVSFAAALAMKGSIPVLAVSSISLQEGSARIIRDVCRKNLHVVFAVGRAGLEEGGRETDQGIFDLSYLSQIPNMCLMAPKNRWELADMLSYAVTKHAGPIAIRFPGGTASACLSEHCKAIEAGVSEVIYDEKGIALLAVGSMVETAAEVRSRLRDQGYSCSLINVRCVKPVDEQMLREVFSDHEIIVTLEENVRKGGFGDSVLEYAADTGFERVTLNIALPDEFTENEDADLLKKEACIDTESILMKIVPLCVGREI